MNSIDDGTKTLLGERQLDWLKQSLRDYCIYDIDTSGPEPKVVLEIYKASEGLALRRPFTWDEVIGAARIKRIGAGD